MSQVLHVSEELCAQIACYALEKREDVDAFGAWLLAEALRAVAVAENTPIAGPEDPFAQLAGITSVDDSEAGLRHDENAGTEGFHAGEKPTTLKTEQGDPRPQCVRCISATAALQ